MAKDDEDLVDPDEEIEEADELEARGGVGFLIGFVVGALVGAGTALLLAPARGDVTRRRIRRRMHRLRDDASHRVDELRDDAEREFRRARRRIKRHLPD
jgi:gas vesicle protein